jgi:hypothetical protein
MVNRIFKPEHITRKVILGRKRPYGETGSGMGSLLLSRGGGGGGSSYSSVNEYHNLTGRPVPQGSGMSIPKSLKNVNEKLQNLLSKPSQKKKNIVF